MVVNIAFYENVFFILSLFGTREFTPASCKSYLEPRNHAPASRILEKVVKKHQILTMVIEPMMKALLRAYSGPQPGGFGGFHRTP